MMNKDVMSETDSDMIRPPINRMMKVLDRTFFRKQVRLGAAQIFDPKDIHQTLAELKSDIFRKPPIKGIVSVPGHDRQTKALLLRPEVKSEGKFLSHEMM